MTDLTDSTGHPYSEWDASYVLGTLSARDRVEFERHLASCARCSSAVLSLRPLPPLLSTLLPSDFGMPDDTGDPVAYPAAGPPATLLPRLLTEIRRSRRRRRWIFGGVAAAVAACLMAAVVLLGGSSPSTAAHPVAMQSETGATLTATVDVRAVAWGTRIDLRCRETAGSIYPNTAYVLLVRDKAGVAHQLGTWKLVPGETTFQGGTALARSDLSRVEVTTLSGTPLLGLTL